MQTQTKKVEVILGDITHLAVDAIVNAANERMLGGGGVDGAIHAAAGRELYEACLAVPEVEPDVRCPTGEARITPAFKLPAKYVIHTVGPYWTDGSFGEDEKLASCYRSVLSLASEYAIESIAFPAISCGVYHFPPQRAAEISVRAIVDFLSQETSVVQVKLVSFGNEMYRVLSDALESGRVEV